MPSIDLKEKKELLVTRPDIISLLGVTPLEAEIIDDIIDNIEDQIIDRIKTMIGDNPNALSEFQNKLLRYGYFAGHHELYLYRFSLREAALYYVSSDFPRVTKKDLPNGIGSITYMLSISGCSQYITAKTASEWLAQGR